MTDYVTDFVQESDEQITELNNALLTLERDPDDIEAMENIFRIAHTLKGNCGAMGLEEASNLAHAIEDLLDAIRSDDLAVSPVLMDVVFDAVDELETMIEEVEATGEIEADPSETIEALREPIDTQNSAPSIDRPTESEIVDLVDRFDPPKDDHDGYVARLAITPDDDVNNGTLVVKALIDAFDLIGTDPPRERIDADEYGGSFDAVFGSAVGEGAIRSGLGPVDEVDAFEIINVTDQFNAAVSDRDADADELAATEPDSGDELSQEDVQDLEVDELLDEFSEFDNLDEKVEELEDDELDAFDEMGEAGSFDDLFDEEIEPAVSSVDEETEPAVDQSTSDADVDADDTDVDDASAVFDELKDEVEMVGFDELQDELDELEFDEFDDGDEVDMDELLGEDVDLEDDSFLGDEPADDAIDEMLIDDEPVDEDLDGVLADDEPVDEELDELLADDEPVDEELDEMLADDEPDDDGFDEMLADDEPDGDGFDELLADDEPVDEELDKMPADDELADEELDKMLAEDEHPDGLQVADESVDEELDEMLAAEEPTADTGAAGETEADRADASPAPIDESGADSTASETGADHEDSETTAEASSGTSTERIAADDEREIDEEDRTVQESAATEQPAEAEQPTIDEPAPSDSETATDESTEPASEPVSSADSIDTESWADSEPVDSNGSVDDVSTTDEGVDDVDLGFDDETATTTDDQTTATADNFGAEDDEIATAADDDFGAEDDDIIAESDDFSAEDDDFSVETDDDTATAAGDDFGDEFDDETADDLDAEFGDELDDETADAFGAEFDDETADAFGAEPGDETADAFGAEFDDDDAATFEDDGMDDAFDDTTVDFDDESFGTTDFGFETNDTSGTDPVDDTGDFGTDPFDDVAADDAATDESFPSGSSFDSDDNRVESFGDDTVETSGEDDDVVRIYDEPTFEIPEISLPEGTDEPDADDETDEIQSVRVDVEQIDSLLTLVEGLVTSRVRLRNAIESGEDPQTLARELDDVEDLTTDLQETVMDVRLVPLNTVANRLPRVVRDIAREQDKEVSFEMTGESVELDRSILDRIGDPLIHLVRNAVDHGIESAEQRAAADKPPEGSVTVTADRSSDRVRITVSDDGSGLDPDRLRSEAIEADILTEDEAADLSDDEAYDLIFHPGLSTADEVTDVSGRGVGMDVVKRTIEDLDGTLEIDSEAGAGTTVTMTLPVTVAIDDILFVESGGEEFGVPIKAVDDIETAASIETVDGATVLPDDDGDGDCRVVHLDEALETPHRGANGNGMVIRIRDEVRPIALHCDDVYGQQEVVVKPFEGFMRDIPGLSGATVRGRGEVVNILDVTSL